MKDDKTALIFLSGQQGSGKSTLCKEIEEVCAALGLNCKREYFAKTLYDFQDSAIKWAASILGSTVPGYFELRGTPRYKNGTFLQKMGDLLRETFGEDILIKEVEDHVDSYIGYGQSQRVVIIEDGRLPGEFTSMKAAAAKHGALFLSIRLECPEETRKSRLGDKWRPATGHKTETGLGSPEWHERFDYVFDTSSGISPVEMAKLVKGDLVAHFGDASLRDRFEEAAGTFTAMLRHVESVTGYGANFKWGYDKEGKKRLEVADIAVARVPSPDAVTKAREEVPVIITKAEAAMGVSQNGQAE
jgi:hypothetical protein